MSATAQGVVVPANTFGKAKTVLQVAMVFALIVAGESPAWLDALVYVTVAVTVASGVDYAFGIRRQVNRARLARRVEPGA
jgi:CDP-diacylglycerol--glycerol-3-phosphate 3-phosphatidyltransferase